MCINWVLMPDGNVRPCHACWQCKRDRVSDWCGRCIAEGATSVETLRLTLTYGRDDHYSVHHPRSQNLHYEDVQKYLKRLRKASVGRVRYFLTGEYGTRNARAHWHLILFFQGGLPPGIRFEERYVHSLWKHGWSYWEYADPEKIRYAVKYILKDAIGGFDRVHRMSTRPEIGAEFFRLMAENHVLQGLPPVETYRFPEDWDRHGRPREYRLSRAALFNFLKAYAEIWKARYGDENWPQSELMDAYCDERTRRFYAQGVSFDDADAMRRFLMETKQRREGSWIHGSVGDGKNGSVVMLYPTQGVYRDLSRGS